MSHFKFHFSFFSQRGLITVYEPRSAVTEWHVSALVAVSGPLDEVETILESSKLLMSNWYLFVGGLGLKSDKTIWIIQQKIQYRGTPSEKFQDKPLLHGLVH